MKFRERGVEREERVQPGEFIIVPRAVEHMPIAEEEVHVMLLEPKIDAQHRQRAQRAHARAAAKDLNEEGLGARS